MKENLQRTFETRIQQEIQKCKTHDELSLHLGQSSLTDEKMRAIASALAQISPDQLKYLELNLANNNFSSDACVHLIEKVSLLTSLVTIELDLSQTMVGQLVCERLGNTIASLPKLENLRIELTQIRLYSTDTEYLMQGIKKQGNLKSLTFGLGYNQLETDNLTQIASSSSVEFLPNLESFYLYAPQNNLKDEQICSFIRNFKPNPNLHHLGLFFEENKFSEIGSQAILRMFLNLRELRSASFGINSRGYYAHDSSVNLLGESKHSLPQLKFLFINKSHKRIDLDVLLKMPYNMLDCENFYFKHRFSDKQLTKSIQHFKKINKRLVSFWFLTVC